MIMLQHSDIVFIGVKVICENQDEYRDQMQAMIQSLVYA